MLLLMLPFFLFDLQEGTIFSFQVKIFLILNPKVNGMYGFK